jgi:hypothetical protein
MTDAANSDTTEVLVDPEAGQTSEDQAAEQQAQDPAPKKDGAGEAAKKTDTLLADAEGEGSDGKNDVPEKYEFTPPEGFDLSEEVQSKLDAFGETAREMGLSQDQYQALVEYDIERGRVAQEALSGQYEERINGWAEIVRADPELGGDKLQQNLAVAKQAIEAFGSPELSKLISAPSEKNPEGLGLGNHPEFIRFMYRVGRSIGEDKLVEGDGRKVDDRTRLQRMYPTMFENAN